MCSASDTAQAGTIAAVVLAAGRSSRMRTGEPKALLPIGNTTFVGMSVRNLLAAGVGPVVVVVGYRGGLVADALAGSTVGSQVTVLPNDDWPSGMYSSIRCGVEALSAERAAGFFIAPVDAPAVLPQTYRQLIGRLLAGDRPGVVRPAFGGRRGHPPLVSVRLRRRLLDWDGTGGLRGFFRVVEGECVDVAVEDPATLMDVDTPEEYRLFLATKAPLGGEMRVEPVGDATAIYPASPVYRQQLSLLDDGQPLRGE